MIDGPALSSDRTPNEDSRCNSQTCDLKSGQSPRKGLNTKTDRLTYHQLKSDLVFDFGLKCLNMLLFYYNKHVHIPLNNFL
jgi:hypothetical protein